MKLTELKALFDLTFASEAESGTLTYPLPATKSQAGRVGVRQGFPVETMTPIAAGGVPPHGADLNGILRMLSLSCQRAECGLILPYSPTFAAAIGGYPKTALVTYGQADRLWMSRVDENQTVPDAQNSLWQPLFANLVQSPATGSSDGKIRAIAMDRMASATDVVLRLETDGGVVFEVPGVTNVEAKLAPMIQSVKGEAPERIIRTMRVDGVSDVRGAFAVVIDEDGATTKLASDLMVSDIVQTSVQSATADCVRTHTPDDSYRQIDWLSGQDNADGKGPVVQAESADGPAMRLPSIPYVQNMLVKGDGLANLKSPNGYVTMPGGVILQWGTYRTSAEKGTADVRFPMNFPTACASVTLTEQDAAGTWFDATPTVHGVREAPTQSGFTAVTRLFSSGGKNLPHEATGAYLAIGY